MRKTKPERFSVKGGIRSVTTALILSAILLLQLTPGMTPAASADLRKNDRDYYVFDTPADLEELCAMQDFSGVGAYQRYGDKTQQEIMAEDFVLEEDLTLPKGLRITLTSRLVVPDGVTLTVPESGSLNVFDLQVDGQIENQGELSQYKITDNDDLLVFPHSEGRGQIRNSGTLTLRNAGDQPVSIQIQGEENTQILYERDSGQFTDDYGFEDVFREAEADPDRMYELYLQQDTILKGEIRLPENLRVYVLRGTVSIPEDSILNSDGYLSLGTVMQVDGKLQNNRVLSINGNGKVRLADETCYSGRGTVFTETGEFPFTGISEERFRYTSAGKYYNLEEEPQGSPEQGGENTENPPSSTGPSLEFRLQRLMRRFRLLLFRLSREVPYWWLVVLAVLWAARLKKTRKGKESQTARQTVRQARPGAAAAGKRAPDFSAIRKAAAQRNRTQNTAQAAPEFEWSAYRPGMELSDYDRQRRMKQLDDWLKTGLIDKEEYRVLKRIYMEEL